MLPPAPDPTVCIVQYLSWNWGRYSVIPLVALQGVMCLLAIYQSLRQSLQLYKATKKWQLNQYFKLLVNQGVLYFFMWVFSLSVTTLFNIYETNRYLNLWKFLLCNHQPESLQHSYRADSCTDF